MVRAAKSLAFAWLALCATTWLGCAASSEVVPGDRYLACDGATTQACTCPDGRAGVRTCGAEAGASACVCADAGVVIAPVDVAVERPDVPPRCGDVACNGTETCETCPQDCGRCPRCDLAPSCTGAVAVPTGSTELASFDNNGRNLYVSGDGTGQPIEETSCLAPRLRLRVRRIEVTRTGVWPDGLDMYCIVNATDGHSSEVMVTPLQRGVTDGRTLIFDPMVSMFWGQHELNTTLNNLTITYQCFRSTDVSAYTSVFGTIRDSAMAAGGVAGPWGWAFGVGSIAAGIVESAIATAGGQTLRLNVQQTIAANALLDLTNGRIWKIQQSGAGGGLNGSWNWTLEVEAWGCSDVRTRPG